MPTIYLQESFAPEEIEQISFEFPHYDILHAPAEDQWQEIEILFGNRLTEAELQKTPRLKWIHSPNTDIEGLCLRAIKEQGNVLVSLSKGQNVPQVAEFVIGAILAFAKQFFHWKEVVHDPQEFWDWPLKETVWTLNKKIFLQVGLGEVGSAIVERANALGMSTWGVRKERSFHPHCHKTFALPQLHSLLPHADIVTCALPKTTPSKEIFKSSEFALMKKDSIFIVVGSADAIDEEALAQAAKKGKFRGILLDAFRRPPPAKNSPLWGMPNGILTPSIAAYPLSEEHLAFRLFRKNLRAFVAGRLNEMKNLLREND